MAILARWRGRWQVEPAVLNRADRETPGALLIAGCLREHEVTAVWQKRRPVLAEDSPIRRVEVARRLSAGVQPAKARAPKQECPGWILSDAGMKRWSAG